MDAELLTPRLQLRPLADGDLDGLASLSADAEVVRYLGGGMTRSRAESAEALTRLVRHWSHGYGVWAMRERDSGHFVGCCGLRRLDDIGEIELLYTLHKEFWGRGYATEAATACVRFAFERAGLGRLLGLADARNLASRHVLEKLGMRYDREAPFQGYPALWYVLTPLDFVARREAERG